MAGTLYGFPFDEELFSYRWRNERDPVLDALVSSGVLQRDVEIAGLISKGSNQYTLPVYNKLTGTELNYDGNTDITADPTTGTYQTGIVYGRMKAWYKKDFVADFNSGADPMGQIIARVAKYRSDGRQARLIKILNGIFGISDVNNFDTHTYNIATAGASVTDANKVDATTANLAMQQALGDSKSLFSLAICHSKVATTLENKQLIEYRKYTDAAGIQRTLALADWNGRTLIIDDGVPVTESSSASGAYEYTTYLFGSGALAFEEAPLVDNLPVEIYREPLKFGGKDTFITRYRETMHPYGFSYNLAADGISSVISPTDNDLALTAAWSRVSNHKNIPVARIITNG